VKALALLVLLACPVAASVSSHVHLTPSPAVPGESVQISYTRSSTLTDGLQDGTVTLQVRGPQNASLGSRAYHVQPLLGAVAANQTLNWTWTPPLPGTYLLTFTDHPTLGAASNQTQEYHVETPTAGGQLEAPARAGRGIIAAGLLALGLVMVASSKPRAAKHRTLRILGAALVLVAIFLVCVWWWP